VRGRGIAIQHPGRQRWRDRYRTRSCS